MSASALAIDVRDLGKSFGKRRVVEGLTLRVPQGEICGFLGGNGSGKTTTIRMLCGLLTPDQGEGTCLGIKLSDAAALRGKIGYMTQRFSFYPDLTVRETLEFVARIYELPKARDVAVAMLARIGLTGRADQLAGTLSGGWKQRLALAAAVIHGPRLLLLDEPTAGVDAKARREFWDTIVDMAAGGMTVLISTHYMDEAERCQRLVYLSGGRIIVSGPADTIIASADLVAFDGVGRDLDAGLQRLRADPRTGAVARFGNAIHAASPRGAGLDQAIAALADLDLRFTEVAPRLDDAFIALLGRGTPS